jgi:hypothetical protein
VIRDLAIAAVAAVGIAAVLAAAGLVAWYIRAVRADRIQSDTRGETRP